MAEIKESLINFFHSMQKFFNNLFLSFKGKNEQQSTDKTLKFKSTDRALVNRISQDSHQKVPVLNQAVDEVRSFFGKVFGDKPDTKHDKTPSVAKNINSKFNRANYELLKPLRYSPSLLDYMKFNR